MELLAEIVTKPESNVHGFGFSIICFILIILIYDWVDHSLSQNERGNNFNKIIKPIKRCHKKIFFFDNFFCYFEIVSATNKLTLSAEETIFAQPQQCFERTCACCFSCRNQKAF